MITEFRHADTNELLHVDRYLVEMSKADTWFLTIGDGSVVQYDVKNKLIFAGEETFLNGETLRAPVRYVYLVKEPPP